MVELRGVSFADKETTIVWQQVFIEECPPGGSRMVFIYLKKKKNHTLKQHKHGYLRKTRGTKQPRNKFLFCILIEMIEAL